jgi:hypothetical protein
MRLASDALVWRHLYLVQHANRLQKTLLNRPNRLTLLEHNILKGIQQSQLENGTYINGPAHRHFIDVRFALDRRLTLERLQRNLIQRPNRDQMQGMIAPNTVTATKQVSPSLLPTMVILKTAFMQIWLKRELSKRPPLTALQGILKGLQLPRVSSMNVVTPSRQLAPRLLSTKLQLEKMLRRNWLSRKLHERPSVNAVEWLMKDNRWSVPLICAPIKPKIRLYEQIGRNLKS